MACTDKTLTNIDTAEIKKKILEREITENLLTVYDALCEKGYNPIAQMIGYIVSEDPTYITTHNGARVLACRLDRDDILRLLLEEFITNHQNENK